MNIPKTPNAIGSHQHKAMSGEGLRQAPN